MAVHNTVLSTQVAWSVFARKVGTKLHLDEHELTLFTDLQLL